MCGSKFEREQWERERVDRELEIERFRRLSPTEPQAEEPEPEEARESEDELVRS